MKAFNLHAALGGETCITRDGWIVAETRQREDHHFYGPYDMPVEFRLEGLNYWCSCTTEGKSIGNSSMDLFMK